MVRTTSRIASVCALLALFLTARSPAGAQELNLEGDVPVLLQADEMSHDRELQIVTARGHVEISRDNQILLADTVSYNQRDDVMTAQGNVSLLEPTGEVVFSEYVELTGDLKNGILEDIRMILSDGARFAANGARRTDGTVHELRKAVYSPCNVCREDPTRAPLWQIKAVKVTQDQTTHQVSYRDAWLEFAGIPVAYTPYLSHPDPTVKRRTGFLVPSLGSSSDLGTVLRVPYFINISPSQDATVTPIYTSDEGPVLAAEYRNRWRKGEMDFSGSITENSEDDKRSHIDGIVRLDLDDTWRTGLDLQRTSDDTYMRRYGFGSETTLTSRLYAEGFRGRNYFVADSYAFQGLEEDDDPGTTPLVLPMVEYHHVGLPSSSGGRTRLDTSLLALTRSDGTDTRRFSTEAGWDLPYIGPLGDVYKLSASIRGDVYDVDDLTRDDETTYDGTTGRALYELSLLWRYPFSRTDGNIQQIIEPIAQAVVSPYGGNLENIPNEDSLDYELDDTNLFSSSRYSGIDQVEGGPRVNYGMRWGVYGLGGGYSSFLIGQSARLREDSTYSDDSGEPTRLSDVVARAEISPGDYFDLTYRTRLDKDNFAAKRNEVSLSAGPDALRLSSSYVFFDRDTSDEYSTSREEFRSSLDAQLDRYWRMQSDVVFDIEDNDTRSFGTDLIYEDECFIFTTSFDRTFYQDRDIEPTDSLFFRIGFKTLGEVATSAE